MQMLVLPVAIGMFTAGVVFLPIGYAILLGGVTLLVLEVLAHPIIARTLWKLIGYSRALVFFLLPLFVVTGTALALSIMLISKTSKIEDAVVCAHSVAVTPNNSGVYRAALDRAGICSDDGRINAEQLPSPAGEETVLGFSFNEILDRARCEPETAGAYIIFYEDPVGFYEFASLSFSIYSKNGDQCPGADIAIKLTLDDPAFPPRDREVVIRVSPSLQQLGLLPSDHWQRVAVDLGEFSLEPFLRPGERIDADTINKIAFFVDNDILDQCPSGTVRIKDIAFQEPVSGCP
jgi:hypothetical protein